MASYETKKVFAENLTRLLKASGKTQSDFAKDFGVAESTVSSWCNGDKMPRMDKIEWMAAYFNVPTTSLIESASTAATREEDLIKAAFWGGDKDLTAEDLDEMFDDVRAYVAYTTQRYKQRKKNNG